MRVLHRASSWLSTDASPPWTATRAQSISGVASKEYSLEKVMEKMDKDWQGVEFRCIEYKDT